MKRIKELIKKKLLQYTIRYISKNKIIQTITSPTEKAALNLINSGFLYEKGWWLSWEKKEPVDKNTMPLPWVTYSFIDFIEKRLNKNMVMFEYGSGNSTLYYSSFVKEVHTVEHDRQWFEKILQVKPNNTHIKNIDLIYGGEYSRASLINNVKYDIVIVDGRDRVNSMVNSIDSIGDSGVIVLDDSERDTYKEGIKNLLDNRFKQLDFWGISPGFISYNKCTSIFYRDNNVLGI